MDTKTAFNRMIWRNNENINENIKLKIDFFNETDDVPRIVVKTIKGKTFGPQPFLAIEKKDGGFVHDNFDFDLKKQIWHYAFHDDTLPLSEVKSIGVASNDIYGNTDIVKLNMK